MSHAPDFSRIARQLYVRVVQADVIERALVRAWRRGVEDGKIAALAAVEAAVFKSKAQGLEPVEALQVVLAVTRLPIK